MLLERECTLHLRGIMFCVRGMLRLCMLVCLGVLADALVPFVCICISMCHYAVVCVSRATSTLQLIVNTCFLFSFCTLAMGMTHPQPEPEPEAAAEQQAELALLPPPCVVAYTV